MYPAGLGVYLALLARPAAGQTITGSSSPAGMVPGRTAAASATTTNAAAGAATTVPAGGARKRHANTHHRTRPKPQSMRAASSQPSVVQES
jgi:hypothetical protein